MVDIVRLSWLSGRALAVQARGVMVRLLTTAALFHFPLFSPQSLYVSLCSEDLVDKFKMKD